ncbi:MAG: hypothetical protein H7X86_14070 [Gorillibacterium sp.]|nr:hypothetical protein [Gorillibacterium sp.]
MKPIQAMLKLHYINGRFGFIIFWSIYLSIFALSTVLLYRFGDTSTTVSGGTIALFIFVFVSGIVSLKETFPYTLGMNLRRVDYMISIILAFISLSVCMGIVNLIMSFIELWIVNKLDVDLAFFSLARSMNLGLTRVEELLINFSGLLQFSALGFLIAAIASRLKKNGMFIVGGAGFLVITLTPDEIWGSVYKTIIHLSNSVAGFALWVTLLSILWFCLSYLLIRRMTVAD